MTTATKKMTPAELEDALVQFSGTEAYHKFSPFSKLVLTDGAAFLAKNAGGGAFWLMDIIASYQKQCEKDDMLRDIQFWTLTVHDDRSATLICERDTGNVAIKQEIPSTDFPLKSVKLYCQNGVILLPSEY